MTRSEAPVTTSYKLSPSSVGEQPATVASALRRLVPLMADERRTVTQALVGRARLRVTVGSGPGINLRRGVEKVRDARVESTTVDFTKPGQDLVRPRCVIGNEPKVDRRTGRHTRRRERGNLRPINRTDL